MDPVSWSRTETGYKLVVCFVLVRSSYTEDKSCRQGKCDRQLASVRQFEANANDREKVADICSFLQVI